MPQCVDVLVVGAGPAGSATARWLAEAGIRVMIADACRFPRDKPCGEALSPGVTPLLEELGLAGAVRGAGAREISGWRLFASNGLKFSGSFGHADECAGADRGSNAPRRGLGIPRRKLDSLLLDSAVAAGARFVPECRVFGIGAHSGGRRLVRARAACGAEIRISARWIVGADGLRSVVARRTVGVSLGRRRRLGLVGRLASDARFDGFGQLRLSGDGCVGLAPTEAGVWNATVVIPMERAREVAADREWLYRSELRRYGLPEELAAAQFHSELQVTGPFDVRPRSVSAPGVFLAGDAAGYFDPLTGQGVYRALRSARMCAHAVRTALANPGSARSVRRAYAERLGALMRPTRRVQVGIDRLVGRPEAMDAAAAWLSNRPGLVSLLLDVTGDRVPAGRLLSLSALASAVQVRSRERMLAHE